MKYWTICFPGECDQHVQETWSAEQIMKSSWYRNWVLKMVQANKNSLMTEQNAIDDWVTVHWAVETDEFGNKI
jgi:hypothetical protein